MPSAPLPAVHSRRCLCSIALIAIAGVALATGPAQGGVCPEGAPPQLGRFVDLPGGGRPDVARILAWRNILDGDLAYTGHSWSGAWVGFHQTLYISDVSGPSALVLGSLDIPPSVSVTFAVDQGFAYFAPGGDVQAEHEFRIVDVSDPAAPRFVGSLPWPEAGTCVAVAGDTAYLGDPVGLHAISVTDVTSPSPLGGVALPGGATAMAVSGPFAYVGTGDSHLAVMDVSNPASPSVMGDLALPDFVRDIAVRGARVYVADGSFGLQVLDVSRPSEPRFLGRVGTPGVAHGVAVSGARAYVPDSGTTLQVVDISNPAHPMIVNSIEILAPDPAGLDPRTVLSITDVSVSDERVITAGREWHGLPPGVDCGGYCEYSSGYLAVDRASAYEPPAPCAR